MSIRVLALDLEGTLLTVTYNPVPRPGLREFLTYCCANFPRVALFTAADRVSAMEALQECLRCGAVPLAFMEKVEFVEWEGEYKDLRLVSDCQPSEVLLVDDNASWIHPEQRDLWVPIAEFSSRNADGADCELERVQSVLEARRGIDRGEAIVAEHLHVEDGAAKEKKKPSQNAF